MNATATSNILEPEILVIGAGPGGSAAAWSLASSGHEVLLVDQADFPRDKTCGDGLTPMALDNLRMMGVLNRIIEAQPARIELVRLNGPLGQTITLPLSILETEHPYALILPRFILDDILRQYAVEAGAVFQSRIRVERIERQSDRVTQVTCRTENGSVAIRAQQVVFAVGANMGLLSREHFIPEKSRVVRAARGYYTDVTIPANRFDFYLDLNLLPGYGWVFPIGNGSANVGVGTLPTWWASKKPTPELLNDFVARRAAEGLMRTSRLSGPIKGFPLRADFPAHRVAGENWVIVGEATGVVNPVTGEGIDLSLASALLAAEIIHTDIRSSRKNHMAYQRELWERFGPLYNGMRVLRDIIATPLFVDYVFWLMSQHDFLKRMTFKITQGLEAPQDVFHPLFILQFFSPISPRWALRELRNLVLRRPPSGVVQ